MARLWNLRFNLDTFNAAVSALADDAERAHFLAGLSMGANGGALRDAASPAWAAGFEMGSAMRLEADGFHARKAAAGQKSAEVRRAASGSAQPPKPRTHPEHCSGSPRTVFDNPSNSVRDLDPPGAPLAPPPSPAGPPPTGPGEGDPRTVFGDSSNGVREILEPIHNLQTRDVHKYPPTPQEGGMAPEPSSSRESSKPPKEPKPPKAETALARLFGGDEDALYWFNQCLAARSRHKVWADARAGKKGVTVGCPANEPSRDAVVFLARVADGVAPRVLHACLRLHLLEKVAADNHCCGRLQVFFGAVDGRKKATWYGYLEAAKAKVEEALAAPPAPPPAPAEPSGPPVMPDHLFASLGLPLPASPGA